MKKYAAKLADDSIIVIQTSSDPDTYLPDGATLIGELSNDEESGEYTTPDTEYRNQWVDNAGSLEVDMTAAREARKDQMRDEREPLLEEADHEINKILDDDGDASAWKTYRKALRDITDTEQAALDACADVAALKAYTTSWPTKP